MFTGILTKVLLGALIGSLAWGGFTYAKYNWWDKPRYEAKIKVLEDANIQLEIQTKAQEATIKYLEKAQTIQRRVSREKQEIKPVVESGSVDDLDRLYGRYRPDRVRSQGKAGPPQNGKRSGPGNPTPPAP